MWRHPRSLADKYLHASDEQINSLKETTEQLTAEVTDAESSLGELEAQQIENGKTPRFAKADVERLRTGIESVKKSLEAGSSSQAGVRSNELRAEII